MVDFDFARYIATRRAQSYQRARSGAAYAYGGERKFRRTLESVKPVSIAIEATSRLWRGSAKQEILDESVRVTEQDFPDIQKAAQRAAKALQIETPPVYIVPASSSIHSQVLGTDDDAHVLLNATFTEHLSPEELVAALGKEFGHIQNNQVLYVTALHYLNYNAAFFVRWSVKPAVMTLQAWSRRAEISSDRAALLASGDVATTMRALVKVSMHQKSVAIVDVDHYLEELIEKKNEERFGKLKEIFHDEPDLHKRIQALQLFAESAFFHHANPQEKTEENEHDDEDGRPGLSADDVDEKVTDLLSVF